MTTIKGKNYESLIVTESGATFVIDEKAELYSGGEISEDNIFDGYAIVEDVGASPDNNTYKINGHVLGMSGGIMTSGINTTIRVGKGAEIGSALSSDGPGTFSSAIMTTGENSKVSIAKGAEVSGMFGVMIGGADSTATNNGIIEGSMRGMTAIPLSDEAGLTGMKLVNNGRIASAYGMHAIAVDGAILENGKNGEIIGFLAGMAVTATDGTQSSTINNFGTIRVTLSLTPEDVPDGWDLLNSTAAILGGLGDDSVRNSGAVYGNIVLAEGDDILDNRGGTIVGRIFGGDGDDTLIVGKAGNKLVELDIQGTDTIQSAFTYVLTDFVENLTLTGKKDINATGNALDNTLTGNQGNNTLTGDAGIDTFVFGTKGGTDTIADFVVGADKIDLTDWAAITDFATLLEKATDVDGSVRIKVGNDILIIDGVLEASLVDTDFTFAV